MRIEVRLRRRDARPADVVLELGGHLDDDDLGVLHRIDGQLHAAKRTRRGAGERASGRGRAGRRTFSRLASCSCTSTAAVAAPLTPTAVRLCCIVARASARLHRKRRDRAHSPARVTIGETCRSGLWSSAALERRRQQDGAAGRLGGRRRARATRGAPARRTLIGGENAFPFPLASSVPHPAPNDHHHQCRSPPCAHPLPGPSPGASPPHRTGARTSGSSAHTSCRSRSCRTSRSASC